MLHHHFGSLITILAEISSHLFYNILDICYYQKEWEWWVSSLPITHMHSFLVTDVVKTISLHSVHSPFSQNQLEEEEKCLGTQKVCPRFYCILLHMWTFQNTQRKVEYYRLYSKSLYHAYFGVKLGDQDQPWAPHRVCLSCESMNNREKHFTFRVPMEKVEKSFWWLLLLQCQCFRTDSKN